ncbi:MAG: hypothetical protein L0387_12960, partial [Acidobacteria bacterium]|nr:hypothetical protein [Acidobacteriota bacterium]MCI0724336.1 hypothetical protein [Acidobacteriota bacterium]
EGFGVGVDDQEPTPALRATPPGRGFSDGQRFTCKIQVLTLNGARFCEGLPDLPLELAMFVWHFWGRLWGAGNKRSWTMTRQLLLEDSSDAELQPPFDPGKKGLA